VHDMVIAVLGHDLRGPLQSVELGAQVIFANPDDPETTTRMATTMQRASRRMARLIDQLLDVARVRLGSAIAVVPSECDLGDIVGTAISELEPAAARARIVLDTSGDPHVTWDRDRVAQVLGTVLENAARHGTADAPITVTVDACGERVAIEVRNQGQVPPELLPMLFDPFMRAESGGKRHGHGLGLYVVDQVVKAHGGAVRVDSTTAIGTSFRIELPRRAA